MGSDDRGEEGRLHPSEGPGAASARRRLEAELRELVARAARQEEDLSRLRERLRPAIGRVGGVSPSMLADAEEAVWALSKTCIAIGEILAEMGRWEEGTAWARRVLALAWNEESRAEASLMLAVMLQRSGWFEEALEAFELSLSHGLEDPRLVAGAHVGAADCLMSLGRAEEAERHCHEALRAQPSAPQALFALTRCLLLQGAWEPAARCLVDAADAGVPGAEFALMGLMDAFQDLPDSEALMGDVKALFDGYKARVAARAATRRSDA